MATAPPQKQQRPVALTIVVVVLFIAAILNILIGVVVFLDVSDEMGTITLDKVVASEESDDILTLNGDYLATASRDVLVGVVQLIIVIGFWQMRKWAWVAAMTWQALRLLTDIIAFQQISELDAITMAFAIFLVLVLNQSDVRRVFGVRALTPQASEVSVLKPPDAN